MALRSTNPRCEGSSTPSQRTGIPPITWLTTRSSGRSCSRIAAGARLSARGRYRALPQAPAPAIETVAPDEGLPDQQGEDGAAVAAATERQSAAMLREPLPECGARRLGERA